MSAKDSITCFSTSHLLHRRVALQFGIVWPFLKFQSNLAFGLWENTVMNSVRSGVTNLLPTEKNSQYQQEMDKKLLVSAIEA